MRHFIFRRKRIARIVHSTSLVCYFVRTDPISAPNSPPDGTETLIRKRVAFLAIFLLPSLRLTVTFNLKLGETDEANLKLHCDEKKIRN